MRDTKWTTTDNKPKKAKTDNKSSTRFSSSVFTVVPYAARPTTPWKVEIRASFAGKKIRRFCATEADAWALGAELVDKIRRDGVNSLEVRAGMPMKAATQAFIAQQEAASKSHRDKTDQICRMLREKFPIVSVTPSELAGWFAKLPGTETTRAMYYRYVRMFFRWARKMRFTEDDPSEVLKAPRATPGRNVLAVEQMTAVLKVPMPAWMRACILLGAFAGLRTEELLRMDWEDIDTKTGEIEIRPGVGKDTGGVLERIVDFTEPLTRRKDQLTGKGKLVPGTAREFHYLRTDIAQALGWPAWPDNCLRHSFATYHLAVSKNAGKTAYQMGHTNPAMVQRVYAVPARKADGAAWWAI
jgi:integrase